MLNNQKLQDHITMFLASKGDLPGRVNTVGRGGLPGRLLPWQRDLQMSQVLLLRGTAVCLVTEAAVLSLAPCLHPPSQHPFVIHARLRGLPRLDRYLLRGSGEI